MANSQSICNLRTKQSTNTLLLHTTLSKKVGIKINWIIYSLQNYINFKVFSNSEDGQIIENYTPMGVVLLANLTENEQVIHVFWWNSIIVSNRVIQKCF